jgi:anti-anti-sigma regulatory factor
VLRITRTNPGDQPATLKLEGRLSGPWVAELSRVVDLSANGAGRVVLDLADLTFADEGGLRLLRTLEESRAELHGACSFMCTLLRGIDDGQP